MSDLRPQPVEIELGGKSYGLLFTLNAIDAIQDRFDIPITDLGDLLRDQRVVFKALKFILTVLINEAIDDMETNAPHVDEQYVGRKITPANLNQLSGAIIKAFSSGAPESEDDDDPNPQSE